MKKKLLWIAGILGALILLATVFGPMLVLAAARQPEPETDFAYSDSFLTTYEEVRSHLTELASELGAEQGSYLLDEGLFIDSFYLPALSEKKNLILLTTGVHGIEGYIGSVMLDVFFGEIWPGLNRETTGVLVVANVNPYGMQNYRRYNENNVDLNRNFILDWENFDLASNKEYPRVDTFLGPEGKMGNALWHEAGFWLRLAKTALTEGADTVSDALLTGQYQYPRGVYYGGTENQASTAYLKDVFSRSLDSEYENIVHIDIHSGYGPRYDMVIFNSVFETMTEAESKAAFEYDFVIAHDSEAFYATTGDTTDFFYRLAQQKQTETDLFSTCFEFGTIGDSFLDSIFSLKYTVDENQNHWYPTDNATTAQVVRENYMELFYPTETQWRMEAVKDFVAAAQGVLKAKLQ